MPATEDFHFLLLPEFSSIGFMSAIEPLRVANRFRQRVGLGALIVESVKLDDFSSVLLSC